MKRESNKSEFNILVYLSLTIASIVAILPILVVVFASFKTSQELLTTGVLELPKKLFEF